MLKPLRRFWFARLRAHQDGGDQINDARLDPLRCQIAEQRDVIARLERARNAAEAANSAKSRYLVAVSHEIRSPLNAIYGYAQLLSRGGKVEPAEAGHAICKSAEYLTHMVESLLEISRIESGALTLRADMVRLPALLEDIISMFRMQADAKGLVLDYRVAGRMPDLVRTDEKRLRQILINLLSNAVKYTQAGGVTLVFAYRSQVAHVDVTDTGPGIAVEDQERIFEPFERGTSDEIAAHTGFGMGLAITRMLAHVMGGEVTVRSSPGEGSCFRLRVFLPEPAAMPEDAAPPRPIAGYAGPQKTVLVIDDDTAQTALLADLLRPLGFVVYTASQGQEAIFLADRCAPELVLLDIQMPSMSGWEVAARLRLAHGRALRIIMVSANVQELQEAHGLRSDHDAHLPKPVDMQALLELIGEQLDLRWKYADEGQPAGRKPTGPLPAGAAPLVAELRNLARIGDARGVEEQLAAMQAAVPESAPAVAIMREHLNDFDLRSLMKALDDVQPL